MVKLSISTRFPGPMCELCPCICCKPIPVKPQGIGADDDDDDDDEYYHYYHIISYSDYEASNLHEFMITNGSKKCYKHDPLCQPCTMVFGCLMLTASSC